MSQIIPEKILSQEILSQEISPQEIGQNMLKKDTAAKMLGIELVEIGAATATMKMQIRPDMLNGFAITHGGLIFALADTTFAYACNSLGGTTVASSASIEFLAATYAGDIISAQAKCVHQGKKTGVYEIVLSNQDHKKIGLFIGRSYRLSSKQES